MPSTLKYYIISLLLFTILNFDANAQRRRKTEIWDGFSITPKAGANHFFGDLVDKSSTSYSGGISAERELKEYLSARIDLMAGNMKGTQIGVDNEIYTYFSNFYSDLSIGATFRPLDLAFGYFKQRMFKPTIIGQFGMIYYNTETHYGEVGYRPNTLRHKVSGISPIVSGGLGVSFYFNKRISFNGEIIGTAVIGDMVDGHKEWLSDTAAGIANVNPTESNDFYYTTTIGVTYLLNDSKWKNAPKYNRKAYLKTRSQYKVNTKNRRIIKKRQKSRK